MRHETDIVGYPILPLVHQLVEMCGEAGRYVHWGATTQDIMDTAVVLQVRAALDIVDADIRELRAHPGRPGEQAPRHADGRPHPPAAGAAGDLRLQGRDLAGDVRPPPGAPGGTAPARAGGRVRRRRRHAGLAGRQGLRGAEGAGRGAGPRRAGHDLARGARRLRRSREPAGARSPARSARSRSTS